MLLYNPTKFNITVSIDGREYSIKEEDTLEIEDSIGFYWKSKIHQFLQIRELVKTVEPITKNESKESKTEEVSKEDNTEEIDTKVEVAVPIIKKFNKKK